MIFVETIKNLIYYTFIHKTSSAGEHYFFVGNKIFGLSELCKLFVPFWSKQALLAFRIEVSVQKLWLFSCSTRKHVLFLIV